jgi:hypothetical protein
VNAAQIGLDKVPNYPTSTSDQAKDPSNTTTLITPATLHSVLATLSTASVESLVSTFQAHVANTENPHQVTAEQIGAITEQQLTEALSGLTMSTFGGKTPQQWESLFIPAATYSELLENLSIAFNGVGTAVGEVDNTSLERVPPINPITGVQAGANGWAYYYADWTTVIVGSTGLPEVLPDGRSTYIDYLDAVYWLDADGYIQSGGTNPRTIPNLTPANNIWSTPSYF